ncbi:hypothetical protein K469DRAFT_522002, partial [Zopfia rhizophila CBS 207.26]
YGETDEARTIFLVVALVCMLLLAGMMGFRARQLGPSTFRQLNFTHTLVLSICFLCICFIIAASVVDGGLGLKTDRQCVSAIYICTVFYYTSKLALYIFLIERAHIVRAPFKRRFRDWVWLLGMFLVCFGFGTLAILAYVYPIAELSGKDGRCRIGTSQTLVNIIVCFDAFINVLLTGIFIWFLRPILHSGESSATNTVHTSRVASVMRRLQGWTGWHRSDETHTTSGDFYRSIRSLERKNLIGSALILVGTVANWTVIYIMKGRELGWLCLASCLGDVTWDALIVSWLTIRGTEEERN